MKRHVGILLTAVLLVVAQGLASGQAKIYTKKAKLEDFTAKTMKVIAEGETPMAIDLRSEISSRWTLSPYEFCKPSDYEGLTKDNSFYILSLASDDGLAFLLLEKGGLESESDRLKKPFEVVRVPIGSAGSSYTFGIQHLDVFIDIIQEYVRESMDSDKYGYGGLDVYNTKNMKGKTIALDVEAAEEALSSGTPDVLVPFFFIPEPEGNWCCKMLVDASTHEVFFFCKVKYKPETGSSFSGLELKSFSLRHAVIAE